MINGGKSRFVAKAAAVGELRDGIIYEWESRSETILFICASC